MDITKISIKRPVTIIMVMCIVVILGFVSLSNMKMELMSSVDVPMALVMTNYEGAGPEEVESLVTEAIEGAVANVADIDKISSTSSEGTSMVMVQFNYGTDMTEAINNIRDKVSMVEATLPDDADSPTILKLDMNSTPVAYVTIASNHMDDSQLKSFVEDKIQPRIERQNGVASVDVTGGIEKEIRIDINPEKLEGLGLDIAEIARIVAAENTNVPGGTIDYGNKSLTISSKLKMASMEEIKKIPIAISQGVVVQLQDIGQISETEKEVDTISRYNGESCINLSITKASDGNTITTVDAVKQEVSQIAQEYDDIHITVVNDTAQTIKDSIYNVISNIFIAAFLAILVLFLFLKNFKLTGVIAISMPLSIVTTFVVLYFSGTSLNLISLGGLSIGVGMLVDNSVVVIENIFRYRTTEGYGKIQGTYRGSKEILSAIVASTLTSVFIFVPFIFTSGMLSEIFTDLALAVVISLLVSLLAALTVVPMLAGNYVDQVQRNYFPAKLNCINRFLDWFEKGFQKLNLLYSKILKLALQYKKRTLIIVLCSFLASLFLLPSIGMELMPSSDEGTISITVEAPKGSKTENVNALSLKVEEILQEIPEMQSITVAISNGQGISNSNGHTSSIDCELVDKKERDKSSDEIAEEIRNQVRNIPGANITVSTTSSMGSMMGGGVTVEIYGDDLDVLADMSEEIQRQIAQIEGTRQITSSLESQDQQVSISINKDKIRQYGMTGAEVATQINQNVSGYVATTLKTEGNEMDVRISYPENAYANLNDLGDMNIKTSAGIYVPLSSIADIGLDTTPTTIDRLDQTRYVTVTCDIFGRDSGSVNHEIQKLINQMSFPQGYTVSLGGSNEMMNETFSALGLVILLAILFVYMVMAAQFESFINPFIIMFTIPLLVTGALCLLFIAGEPISMTALIGCLVLVGIVVNNGIVLIDFIKVLRERDGLALEEAVLKACPTRLRPILMTAVTTILAQFPMIFSNGTNSETLRGMGLVVAGGLATSTILTLVLIPVLYMYSEKIAVKLRTRFKIKPKKNKYEIEAECN